MPTSTSLFVILSCFVVSLLSQRLDETNSYCMKARLKDIWYFPIPGACCDLGRRCGIQIQPLETNFGLRNPDPKWSRRLCSCDLRLYLCVTWGLNPPDKAWVRYGFAEETCFRAKPPSKVYIEGQAEPEFEFVRSLDFIDSSEGVN